MSEKAPTATPVAEKAPLYGGYQEKLDKITGVESNTNDSPITDEAEATEAPRLYAGYEDRLNALLGDVEADAATESETPSVENTRTVAGTHAEYHAERPDTSARGAEKPAEADKTIFHNVTENGRDQYYTVGAGGGWSFVANGAEAFAQQESAKQAEIAAASRKEVENIPETELAQKIAAAELDGKDLDGTLKKAALQRIMDEFKADVVARGGEWSSTDTEVNDELTKRLNAFVELIDLAKTDATSGLEAAEATPEATDPKVETEDAELEVGTEVEYNGKKVTIFSPRYKTPSGIEMYEIVEGSKVTPVLAAELVYAETEVADEVEAESEATDAETESAEAEFKEKANAKINVAGEGMTDVIAGEPFINDENGYEYVEIELADGRKMNVLTKDVLFDGEKEKLSLRERAKKLWKKIAPGQKLALGYAWLGAQWTVRGHKFGEATIQRDVTEEMSPEEKAEQEKKNRRELVAGRVAGGVLAATAIGVGLYFGIHAIEHAVEGANNAGAGTGGMDTHIQDTLQKEAAERAKEAAEAAAAAKAQSAAEAAQHAAEFNVTPGEGGIQLLQSLKFDNPADTWAANQDALLNNFPNELYRMPNGGVGIAEPGTLSEGLRNAIDAIRR